MGRTENLGEKFAATPRVTSDEILNNNDVAALSESSRMCIALFAESSPKVKLIAGLLIWEALSTRQEQVGVLLKQMSNCANAQNADKFLPAFEHAYNLSANKNLSLDEDLDQAETSVVAQVSLMIGLLRKDEEKKSLIDGIWADLDNSRKMWVILSELKSLEQNILKHAQSLAPQLGNHENQNDLGRNFSIGLLFGRLKKGVESASS